MVDVARGRRLVVTLEESALPGGFGSGVLELLESEGIDTGIDVRALIEAALLAEEVVGHELWGHVSKAGPRPYGRDVYPMDLPFIETFDEAQHFRVGPQAYEGGLAPWKEPITSSARDSFEQSLLVAQGGQS